MNALIVECDSVTAETLKELLMFMGLKAFVAENASKALSLLQTIEYDIVFLDHHTCFIEKMCDKFNQYGEKIILMTSYKTYQFDFKNLHYKCLLKKPFGLNEIEQCLSNWL